MLKRWQVEKDVPLSSEDLAIDEVHRELKAMLEGKDWKWTKEDCVSYNGPLSVHQEGATFQSLPGDICARWRKDVEPGRWEYVVLPAALEKAAGPALPQATDVIMIEPSLTVHLSGPRHRRTRGWCWCMGNEHAPQGNAGTA